jgi:3-oxoacyl-[acyl-carrier protein] reductase
MDSLLGKVALVTGASRGIGRAVALSLARAGADLVLAAEHAQGAEAAGREVMALKRRAVAVGCDVAKPEQVDALVQRARSAFERIDILVNNAGVALRAPVTDTGDADFDRVIAVNLAGPFYLTRRLLPEMVKRGWGRIVNVSSISGTLGTPLMSAYCASKWGLNGLTKAVAAEVQGTGVTVTAVLPGSVDTRMLEGSEFAARMSPEEVASVVRFLCAEAPAAINGSLVEVFG